METLELKVRRIAKRDNYTIGKLSIDGKYFCDTLEDTDRGLTSEMSENAIRFRKQYGKTAIPTGRYRITLKVQSPKFRSRSWARFCDGYLPRLEGVKGFEGVLVHCGNTAQDTSGCLLVGENRVKGTVVNSTATFEKLYSILSAADKLGKEIWITYE